MDMKQATSKVGAGLSRAQDHIEDWGNTAGQVADNARHETAAVLENAGATVRTTGHETAGAMENLSRSAAGKLDSTAGYVRTHDLGDMLADFRQAIGRHPTGFFLLAAGIGFLAGSAVRRNK